MTTPEMAQPTPEDDVIDRQERVEYVVDKQLVEAGVKPDGLATDAEVASAIDAVLTQVDNIDLSTKQDAATAATDAELSAAIAAIPTPDLSTKQDASTAATDTELAAEASARVAADALKQDASTAATDLELAEEASARIAADALKQDASTAATDAELAAAIAAIPAPTSSPFTLNGASNAIVPVDKNDSWVIGSDRFSRDAADATKDIRGFFDKVKGAFRVGRATAAQWDDVNVGLYSHAESSNNIASGQHSHAEGNNTFASGFESHAEGNGTLASQTGSHAEGVSTVSSGIAAHAEGHSTTAEGNRSHAEGTGTRASGFGSHAEGDTTIALGAASHAEGNSTFASGFYSHAEGDTSTAGGFASHAEGDRTQAYSAFTHAEGSYAKADRWGQYARAAGQFTSVGDAQINNLVLRRISTDATATVLTATAGNPVAANGNSPIDTDVSVLTIKTARAYMLKISTVARRTDTQGVMAGFVWEGLVGRDSSGSARIIGVPSESKWNDLLAAGWLVTVSINTTDATNNYVAITVTGQTGNTIRWVAKADWVEVAG